VLVWGNAIEKRAMRGNSTRGRCENTSYTIGRSANWYPGKQELQTIFKGGAKSQVGTRDRLSGRDMGRAIPPPQAMTGKKKGGG